MSPDSMSRKDIIRWVIDVMLEEMASATGDDLAERVERKARREWGGQRIDYVAKRVVGQPGRPPKLDQSEPAVVDEVLRSPETMDQLADRHGVSRSTLYRAIKRRARSGGHG
jgi:predicted transcriptional regulator